MSTTILFIGLMVFFAHFLSLQFRKTNIPDALVLVFVGIVLGPVLNFVSPTDFGKVGSLFATIALVVILFEGGTTLDMNVLGKLLAVSHTYSATGQASAQVRIISARGATRNERRQYENEL